MSELDLFVLEGVKTALEQRKTQKQNEPDFAWLFLEGGNEEADVPILFEDGRERSDQPDSNAAKPPRKSKKLVQRHPKEEPKLRLPNLFSPTASETGSKARQIEVWFSPLSKSPHRRQAQEESEFFASTRAQDLDSFLFSQAGTGFIDLESRCGVPLNRPRVPAKAPGTPLLSPTKLEKASRHQVKAKDKHTEQASHRTDAASSILGSDHADVRAEKSHQILQRALGGEDDFPGQTLQQGPPSRHVSTRAKDVILQARRMAEGAPRQGKAHAGLRVADSVGNVHDLCGVIVQASGERSLTRVEPFPIFCQAGATGKPFEPKLRKPVSEEDPFAIKPSDLRWDSNKEMDTEVQEILARSASAVQDAADPNAETPVAQKPRSRSVHDLMKKPKREVMFKSADLVSASLRWGKSSSTSARIEALRKNKDKQEALRNYVTKELPRLKRREQQCPVDYLKQNVEEAKEGEFITRAPSLGNVPGIARRTRRRSSIDFRPNIDLTRTSSASEDNLMTHETKMAHETNELIKQSTADELAILAEKDSIMSVLCAMHVARFAQKMNEKFQKRQRKEVAASFRAILFVQRWYKKVKEESLVKVVHDVADNGSARSPIALTKGLVMKCQMNVRLLQKRGNVGIIVAFLRDLRMQSDVKVAVKRYRNAVLRVQRCVRSFLAVRRQRWALWVMQWTHYEKKKNRDLMRIWRRQWQQTTQEISRVLKLKPGSDRLKNKKVRPATVRWVSNVMDDFIQKLPPEVKNIMDVPEDIRDEILTLHKAQLIHSHLLQVESHRRRKEQVQENRRFRDVLFVTFPKLSEMDLKDPELQFLVDCNVDPIRPFLTPILSAETLEGMIERGKNIARGLEPRRVFVGKGVTRTDRRTLPVMHEESVTTEDGELNPKLQKYLVTKNETNQMMSELVDLGRDSKNGADSPPPRASHSPPPRRGSVTHSTSRKGSRV